jgi:hypothetical protein
MATKDWMLSGAARSLSMTCVNVYPGNRALNERKTPATPNDEPTVIAARSKFHEGLRCAGMAER